MKSEAECRIVTKCIRGFPVVFLARREYGVWDFAASVARISVSHSSGWRYLSITIFQLIDCVLVPAVLLFGFTVTALNQETVAAVSNVQFVW